MDKHHSAIVIILVMVFSCTPPSANPETIQEPTQAKVEKKNIPLTSGKVVGISDGDTFTLLVKGNTTVRVRLYGIDAPEKAQDFGIQAKQKLSALIFSKRINVEEKDTDRYGRLVGVVYVHGLNVNEEMLRAGYAWHYTLFDENADWDRLEQSARLKGVGLWRRPTQEAPWEWRKEMRKAQGIGH